MHTSGQDPGILVHELVTSQKIRNAFTKHANFDRKKNTGIRAQKRLVDGPAMGSLIREFFGSAVSHASVEKRVDNQAIVNFETYNKEAFP
jgi:hypothetical protein